MAHFAQLDDNNVVINIIVVHNNELLDQDGNEVEQKGIDFCKSLFGQDTEWVQTSYNGNFRKNYASATQKITKNSSDTIRLTRHTQASTLEKFYIGEDQEYNAEIANKVDSEFFDFAKLAAV